MITVHKYEWPHGYDDWFLVSMPLGADILCVQMQRERICIWAKADTSNSFEQREFQLCCTGNLAPAGKYIGTVQLNRADLILHIFEMTGVQ